MWLKRFINEYPVLFRIIAVNCLLSVISGIMAFTDPYVGALLLKENLTLASDWHTSLTHPWTYITYMFTQFSFLHLLFNMMWLFWFGKIFLFSNTRKNLLITYLGGGLTGAILFMAVVSFSHNGADSYLIGSSAAVLAVMTTATLLNPNLELHLLLLGPIRLKYVALICIGFTFAGIGGGNAGGFSAHLGGIIFGICVYCFITRSPRSRKSVSSIPLNHNVLSIFRKKPKKKVPVVLQSPIINKTGPDPDDEARLDTLLDKVRISGYDSLTSAEKRELNAISSRL
ncbi:MAG: rhomboid family intramembrane serine protease [Muribaculaceae bacterium]|nr:rhomboid family intramembrane serine protease [Muribaculaceae bacterium]